MLSCENVKNATTKDGKSDIAYRPEEEKLREVGNINPPSLVKYIPRGLNR